MWIYNGINFATKAWVIEQIDGLGLPGPRGENITLAGANGQRWVSKLYDAQRLAFKGRVKGCDPSTGLVTTTPKQHLEDNIDYLTRGLASRKLRALSRVMDDGSIRIAEAEVAGQVEFAGDGKNYADFVIDLALPDPLFYSAAQRSHSLVGDGPAVVIDNPGTAEADRLTISLTGPLANPKLTNLTTDVWLQLNTVLGAGQTAVIVTHDYSARYNDTSAISAIRHSGDFRWLYLLSGENQLQLEGGTGTARLDYYPAYF